MLPAACTAKYPELFFLLGADIILIMANAEHYPGG